MCDRRELERMREQRDDAIERGRDRLELLIQVELERDALADILADVTFELAETTARLEAIGGSA